MPRKIDPRLGFSYGWLRGEDFWGDPMSENMLLTSVLLHPAPLSMSEAAPPISPLAGSQYIVPAGATGVWAGETNSLVTWVNSDWFAVEPFVGLRVRVQSLNEFRFWNGTAWTAEPVTGAPEPLTGTKYDISCSVGYSPDAGETLLHLPIVANMLLPAGAPASRASIAAIPSTASTLSLARNGTPFGTVTFSASGHAGVFAVASDVTFATADRLSVNAPSTVVPADMRNFGVVLRLTLL